MTTAAEFNKVLKFFTKTLVPTQAVLFQKGITLEALRRVVLRTPVDTGRARGNWQTTIDTIPEAEKLSQNPVLEGAGALTNLRFGSTVYITNNLSYINVLDKGGFVPANPGPSKDKRQGRRGRILVRGGFSVQAPNGMISVTLAELKGLIR